MIVFLTVWTAIAIAAGYGLARVPITITISENNVLMFESPVRSVLLRPEQIIEFDRDADGDWSIVHVNGRIDLRHFDPQSLKLFASAVAEMNPDMETPWEWWC